jgi:co-chaperonin GroES (HSP10)
MKIRPLSTQVLLEKFGALTSLSKTLFIPEASRPDHYEYRVVAVGSKVPADIKPGLRVVASPWVGKEFEHEGASLRLVHFNECQMLIGVPAQ